jgi:hypothetical protein
MRQLSLNITPEFDRDLRRFMRERGIARKSDAVRLALREAVARSGRGKQYDFRTWLGLALKAPLRRKPKFHGEDDLWS